MSTTHQDKPGGKPRQRSRKADRRGQKAEQRRSPKLDQRDEDQIGPMVASIDAPTDNTARLADVPLVGEVLTPDVLSIGAVQPADNFPINIQAIANAYADYTRKSFQESRFYFERLMAVRSFDKAMEVQSEFARQAYANFIAESQKICELYSGLSRQIFRPWDFAAKLTQAGR